MPRDPIHPRDKEEKEVLCFLALNFKEVIPCPLVG